MRPFRDEDLNSYAAMLGTPELRESLRLPDHKGRPEAWFEMASWLGQWELRGTGHWALEEKESGTFIGRAGLHNPERDGWPGVEVGWALHPDKWGLGYATEAGEESIRYAFEDLDEDCLFSTILPGNYPSLAVAERLGFVFVGLKILSHYPEEPHGIWALEKESWMP